MGMEQIEHLVLVMMENRSFDHYWVRSICRRKIEPTSKDWGAARFRSIDIWAIR